MSDCLKFAAFIVVSMVSTSAFADMGAATRWLFSQPFTRLDGLVVEGTRQMQGHFVEPNEDGETFLFWLKSNRIKPGFTHLSYDRERDAISAWYSTQMTLGPASDPDCIKLLVHLREQMLILSEDRNALEYLGTPEGHARLAAELLSVWARAPSHSDQSDKPTNLGAKLADISRVKVMIFGADLARPMKACSGSLSGTDFKQGIE